MMIRLELEGLPVPLGLRLLEDGDRAFVASTWATSYRARSLVPRRFYDEGERRVIDRCLAEGHTPILCSPTVPRTIFGWACAAGDVLHYAYVVPELRGKGVGHTLVAAARGSYGNEIETTHRWPWPSDRFLFNPYRLLEMGPLPRRAAA